MWCGWRGMYGWLGSIAFLSFVTRLARHGNFVLETFGKSELRRSGDHSMLVSIPKGEVKSDYFLGKGGVQLLHRTIQPFQGTQVLL